VRVNPWNEESEKEINNVIIAGAEIITLPMWKKTDEVRNFIKAVDKRAKTVLLLETKEAENCLDDVLKLDGIDEIHIGLNDLHLCYKMDFMFELLANGIVEKICTKIRDTGLVYGFGGISKIGDGMLPAEKIVLEHYRLGSTRAILSRSFCDTSIVHDIKEIESIFAENMKKLREFEKYAENVGIDTYLKNQSEVLKCVEEVVCKIREHKK